MFCCAYSSAMRVGRQRRELRVAVVVDDPDQAGRVFRDDGDAAEERADQPGFLRRFVRGRRRDRGRRRIRDQAARPGARRGAGLTGERNRIARRRRGAVEERARREVQLAHDAPRQPAAPDHFVLRAVVRLRVLPERRIVGVQVADLRRPLVLDLDPRERLVDRDGGVGLHHHRRHDQQEGDPGEAPVLEHGVQPVEQVHRLRRRGRQLQRRRAGDLGRHLRAEFLRVEHLSKLLVVGEREAAREQSR